MTQTLTTERLDEIAKLAVRLFQISGCAAATSSGETVLHHTHVDEILSALHDVTAELLANREAQPVYQCRFFTTDIDGKQIGEWQDMDKGFYDQYDPYCRRILYTAPTAPAVPRVNSIPDAATLTNINQLCPMDSNLSQTDFSTGWNDCRQYALTHEGLPPVIKGVHAAAQGWNACRAAMLTQPVSQGYKLVPVEPTDEQLRAMLAVSWPATYREHLRHPDNGPNSSQKTESEIKTATAQYAAMLATAPEGGK